MITATLAAMTLVGAPVDKWEIKPPLAKDSKSSYSMEVDVSLAGQSHNAKFTWTTKMGEKPASEETTPATVTWHGIEVDGNTSEDLPEWNFKLNKQGAVTATKDLEDDYRRMMTPFFFVYPDKGVETGDKWEVKVGTKDAYVYNFEAKGVEKVKNEDTLKITGTFKEGEKGMSGSGTWWVGKDGKLHKFDLKIKDWVAPFTGSGGELIEATVKGSAA